jgi:1,2-diacylglycerol 3-alpha-glucosyltransferase
MRILIATDTYPPHVNGAAYFSQRLAHGLAAHGHEVAVLAPGLAMRHTDSFEGSVRLFGVRSYPLVPRNRSALPEYLAPYIRRVLREFRPDVVHIQNHYIIGRVVAREAHALGIPLVATNHFMPENISHYLHLPGLFERQLDRLLWRDAARVMRRAQIVTSPSETAATALRPWLPQVEVISNGIDLTRFNPHDNPAPARERYRLPDVPLFIFVGRLDREKNIGVLLRAAALAQEPLALVIAGTGFEKDRLPALAKALGVERKVIFTGFVDDALLPSLYAACDCFVNACSAELQCLTALEAMATGLPVLLARAMALPELVEDNGYLFKPGDAQELAARMDELARNKDERRRMGTKSLRIAERHNIEHVLGEFESLYRKAVSRASARTIAH